MALLITIALFVLSGEGGAASKQFAPILAAVPLILLLTEKSWKGSVIYFVLYGGRYIATLGAPHLSGLPNFLVVAICGFFMRFVPGIMMGYITVRTTTVSEFVASMKKLQACPCYHVFLSTDRARIKCGSPDKSRIGRSGQEAESIRQIGFHVQDVFFLLLCVVAFALALSRHHREERVIQCKKVSFSGSFQNETHIGDRKGHGTLRNIDLSMNHGDLYCSAEHRAAAWVTPTLWFNGLIPHYYDGKLEEDCHA